MGGANITMQVNGLMDQDFEWGMVEREVMTVLVERRV